MESMADELRRAPRDRPKVTPWNTYNSPPETPLNGAGPAAGPRSSSRHVPETTRTLRSSTRTPSSTKTPSRDTVPTQPHRTPRPRHIPSPVDGAAAVFQPGQLVLRRRPSRFVHPGTVDADEYDGPFVLASTDNPAPAHLRNVRGGKSEAWAKLELPSISLADQWIRQSQIVRYTGSLMAEDLREATKEVDGLFIMDKIRNERWVKTKHAGVLAREFKVSWLGYPSEDDTWETEGKVSNADWQMIEEYERRKV